MDKKDFTGKWMQGFTLVELMIVIAILAILAVVSMGYLANSVNNSKCAEVESAVNEALLAAVRMAADKNIQPLANATDCTVPNGLCLNFIDTVATVTVAYNAAAASPITVSGTAVGNVCPRGTTYVLGENQANGQWQP